MTIDLLQKYRVDNNDVYEYSTTPLYFKKHDVAGYVQIGDIHGNYYGTWHRTGSNGRGITISCGNGLSGRFYLSTDTCFHGDYATPEKAAYAADVLRDDHRNPSVRVKDIFVSLCVVSQNIVLSKIKEVKPVDFYRTDFLCDVSQREWKRDKDWTSVRFRGVVSITGSNAEFSTDFDESLNEYMKTDRFKNEAAKRLMITYPWRRPTEYGVGQQWKFDNDLLHIRGRVDV